MSIAPTAFTGAVNFVCEEEGSASAVLIRALKPTHGPRCDAPTQASAGRPFAVLRPPGKLTEALGITIAHNALPLDRPARSRCMRGRRDVEVATGIRIGITKAVELPWRHGVKGSKFLSKPFPR